MAQLRPDIFTVTSESFQQLLDHESRSVLFDFWAPWCRPCRELEPVLTELVTLNKEAFVLAKVNIDMHIEVAKHFGVRSLPTLLLVKDGKEVTRLHAGSYHLDRLKQELGPYLWPTVVKKKDASHQDAI